MRQPRRRRHRLVNPRFQLTLAFWVGCLTGLFSLAWLAASYYPLRQALLTMADLPERARLASALDEIQRTLLFTALAVTLLAMLLALYAAHRIAGPLFRLQQILKAMIEGDFSHQVEFRKMDAFKEFQSLVNLLGERMAKLKRQAERDRELLKLLREQVGELDTLVRADDWKKEEIRRFVAKVRRELATLENEEVLWRSPSPDGGLQG